MLLVLPAVFAALYAYAKISEKEMGDALAKAILAFELLLLIITNILSVFAAINSYTIFFSWLLVLFAVMVLYGKKKGSQEKISNRDQRDRSLNSLFLHNKLCLIMLLILIILSLILLIGALFTVPYNYDSMSYHLARIGYWMDHGSVAHYVSNIDRQIYSPVLAEYNLLHMMLLSGSDTFVNLLQYLSMFAAAFFIYQSTRRLGTDRTFSLFGVFVFMLMPLTISQSITTQNDLFVVVFFAIFVYELIAVVKWDTLILDKEQRKVIILLSLTVAFAYLAKTSVCASMLMFMPWLLIVRLCKKDKFTSLAKSVGMAVLGIGLPISETLVRTYLSSGSFMTDTAGGNIMVATKNVSYILVNILKNYSLLITQHICRPLNGFVYRIAIHTGQRLGVEVNNEAIAFHGFDFLHHMNMGEDMYSHDKTPSAFAAYLAFLGGILLLVLLFKLFLKRKTIEKDIKKQWSLSLGFAISAWLSFGFIMALLRWQPWGTRLMYPALAVTVVMSANLLWIFLKDAKKGIQGGILLLFMCLCVALAVPSLTYNMVQAENYLKNGCKNRISYYFVYNHRQTSYEVLIERAKAEGVADIGLLISGDGYDYPLWLMFHEAYPQGKLRHIINEDKDFAGDPPDAILFVERDSHELGDIYEYGGASYVCTYVNIGNFDAYFSREK